MEIKDIQNLPDFRQINIKKVGVKNISYPITVLDKAKKTQKTVATVNMYVNLPHSFKGTHMSRFVEILNRFHGAINLTSFHHILEEMKVKLQAEEAHMEIEFPYFLRKTAADHAIGVAEYHCKMHGSLSRTDDLLLEVRVPIAPPAPAQADLSLPKSLGHWGVAIVSLRFKHFIWIEDIIDMVEAVTSHDLTWPDHTTPEQALSVETITSSLGRTLSANTDIRWFNVTVKNLSQGCSTFASIES